jgi:hypothetical protein
MRSMDESTGEKERERERGYSPVQKILFRKSIKCFNRTSTGSHTQTEEIYRKETARDFFTFADQTLCSVCHSRLK